MSKSENIPNRIARIENAFVENAQYNLSVREQKVILYLISRIDPRKDNFCRQCVPVKELEEVLKKDGKKWGGLYKEMEIFSDKITDRKISFPSNVLINGKPLKGHINWFAHAMPVETESGEVALEFEFAPILKNFLLKLKEFVKIDRLEISQMKYRYSIRLYQLFKAALQKQEKFKKQVSQRFSIDEIRYVLKLDEKYSSFKSLNQFVISRAVKEINAYTSLYVEPVKIRNRLRKVEMIEFKISYKKDVPHLSRQLSLLEEKTEAGEMTRAEIIAKKKNFSLEKFKKKYPKVYKECLREVYAFVGDKMDFNHPAFQNSLRGACETWYIENGK